MKDEGKKSAANFRKKGGTIFPRVTLGQAVKYAKKLVSKTHTGAQPRDTLFPGVFGAGGSRANTRSSALKQYGLLTGSDKDGYKATDLAIAIDVAPLGELQPLLRQACIKPRVFGMLFNTYNGDQVSLAKLRQQASSVKVHPEELDNCAQIFVESAVYAGLATQGDDQITLVSTREIATPSTIISGETSDEDSDEDPSVDAVGARREEGLTAPTENSVEIPQTDERLPAKAVIRVNVNLDSSFDTDKLERQLQLLRKFGAL